MLLAALYGRNKVKYIMFFKCKRENEKNFVEDVDVPQLLDDSPDHVAIFQRGGEFY
jgi:hypothetical protein